MCLRFNKPEREVEKRLETQQQLGSCRTEAFNVLFDRLAKVIR